MTITPWELQHSETAFETPYFRLRRDVCRLPDGRIVPDYYVYESVSVAMVFALTRAHEVLLVEQYKHGWGEVLLELPAGMCESDNPLHDAQRELLEETGYQAEHWQPLGRYIPSPTRANNEIHTFLALDAELVAPQALDNNEEILVHRLPLGEMLTVIDTGRVRVADSVATIYAALRRLGKL